MNKQELSSHLKQATESIDDILKAVELPLDLPDYSPEQVKVLEEIVKLFESKQAKTYKEAGILYRKGQNEHQLNEIALRYAIAADRIPEILKAMKLKVEALGEPQFELFREVCQSLQSGVDLPLAAQATLDKGKGAKGKKAPPEFVAQESAIAPTNGRNGSAIAQATEAKEGQVFDLNLLPESAVNNLKGLAKEEFDQRHDGLVADAANGILDEMDTLSGAAHQAGVNIAREAIASGMAAAAHTGATKRVIDEVKRQRRSS